MSARSVCNGIEPWDWVIGTGVYLDDVENAIAAKRAKMLRTSWKVNRIGHGRWSWSAGHWNSFGM